VEVGAQPDEVVVHVDGDGGGRRDVRDLSLQAVDRAEVEARTAERLGHRGTEVATLTQVLEVLGEEGVVAVVPGRALVESGEQVGVEQSGSGGCNEGHWGSPDGGLSGVERTGGRARAHDHLSPLRSSGENPPSQN
jgi:hypothetical protein